MKKLALAALCGVLCGIAIRPYVGAAMRAASSRTPSTKPLDPPAWHAKVDLFEHLDRAAGPHVVYLGDSITERINVAEFHLPGNPRIVNRSIAGDTTNGVRERIRRSFPGETTLCFLLIGYNDLRKGVTPEDTARAVQAIAEYLIAERGVGHVVIEAVPPPRNETFAAVADLNALLERWTRGRSDVSFLDLFVAFLAPDGTPNPGLFADAIHLSAAGALRRATLEADHVRRIRPAADTGMRSPVRGWPGRARRDRARSAAGSQRGRLSSDTWMTFVALGFVALQGHA